MTEVKLTAKQKLINAILGMSNNTYSANDCNEMKVAELKELLAEMKAELIKPEAGVDEAGKLVVPELSDEQKAALAKVDAPAKKSSEPKAPKEKGTSKREVLYAIFDTAHAAGESLKNAAKAALPETSDGVIASYATYWRKERGVVSERKFGNAAPKATKAEKALAALRKIYGEEFDFNEAANEICAVIDAERVAQTETAE